MVDFLYLGAHYNGLNPSGVTFQRQTNEQTCWAACIANARSVLLGKTDVTDLDILKAAHLDTFKFQALADKEMVELISYVSHITNVMPAAKPPSPAMWMLTDPGAIDALSEVVAKELPVVLGLENPKEEIGHDVLLLAVGGQMGLDYLVYDPQTNGTPGQHLAVSLAMQAFTNQDTGGLKVFSFDIIKKYGKWAIPLRKKT